MLIYLLSKLCLFLELCYVTSYLLYLSPVMLFITSRRWVKFIVLLYFVILVYDMIKLLVMRLIWYLYPALPSCPYLGSHLSETINNYTFSRRPNLSGRHLPSLSPSRTFKPARSYCCVFWMWFRSCLGLYNYLRLPLRDHPQQQALQLLSPPTAGTAAAQDRWEGSSTFSEGKEKLINEVVTAWSLSLS